MDPATSPTASPTVSSGTVRDAQWAKMSARDKLVRELLDTEKAHVALLELFVHEYLEPLRAEASLISKDDLLLLGSNIELLLAWNTQFYRALRKCLKKDISRPFAHVLLHMVPMLRQLYTQYSENYDRALGTYERCKNSNKAFMLFLSQRHQRLGGNRDFLSCLYLPIQRMLSYDTLLNSILSHTPSPPAAVALMGSLGAITDDGSAPNDVRDISRALQSIRAVMRHANERALQRKNIDRVLAIQDAIQDESIPPLAVPHRRYVYEGEVTLIQVGGREEKKLERHLFLFNDLLICTRAAKRSARAGKIWDVEFLIGDLHTVAVEDIVDADPYRFGLRTPGQTYLFSSREKNAWMQLVQDATARLGLRAPLSSLSEVDKSSTVADAGLSREQLVALICEWSRSDDAEAVLMEIKELAVTLQPSVDFADEENEEAGPSTHKAE